ncbi:CinA family protein [Sphaerotilus microaerophilus]|jgi:nicotinamide-nucleotide amidase|uniref:Competence damage-inducible protein A n=1 Tax=Sphaerotilus microaerophilus TaxID=2914710 RepID=A0ABN6PJL0_9BURK|nr:CinA family protein [Sphaerotilus sp. FB-5]BDI03880.1 competence damage-inducible protein A [Sphaerotilus sp. FB-5]
MPHPHTADLVIQLADRLRTAGWTLATAESCTGGLIAAACTELAGSSDWFERGFVTYSNAAKTELLGVDASLIDRNGAVSEPVARAMAVGAAERARCALALSVTGVAGPSGGSAAKPVGTVWFGWRLPDGSLHSEVCHFDGDRAAVRAAAARHALAGLLQRLAAG